jgi:hypothetical protein
MKMMPSFTVIYCHINSWHKDLVLIFAKGHIAAKNLNHQRLDGSVAKFSTVFLLGGGGDSTYCMWLFKK